MELQVSTLTVTGASNGNTAIAGTLNVKSDMKVNTDKFVYGSNGNTAIAGTLDVAGTVTSTGDFDVATNKFTVTASMEILQ